MDYNYNNKNNFNTGNSGGYSSGNQLNNVKPRTREQREAMQDKESIEKARINQRVGFESRNVAVKELLHNSDPHSTLFIPENQRFDQDFAVFDKQKREDDLYRKEFILEKHRIEALERESKRWQQIENEQKKDLDKRDFQANVLKAGKRNTNGMPFNPITLEYEKSSEGVQLKQKDEQSQVRAFVRAQNLDTRSNTNYNVISGETRLGVDTLVPDHLQNDFDKKLKQKDDFYSVQYNSNQGTNKYY